MNVSPDIGYLDTSVGRHVELTVGGLPPPPRRLPNAPPPPNRGHRQYNLPRHCMKHRPVAFMAL